MMISLWSWWWLLCCCPYRASMELTKGSGDSNAELQEQSLQLHWVAWHVLASLICWLPGRWSQPVGQLLARLPGRWSQPDGHILARLPGRWLQPGGHVLARLPGRWSQPGGQVLARLPGSWSQPAELHSSLLEPILSGYLFDISLLTLLSLDLTKLFDLSLSSV